MGDDAKEFITGLQRSPGNLHGSPQLVAEKTGESTGQQKESERDEVVSFNDK